MSFIQTFGGDPTQPAPVSYIQISLSANTTLSWPIQFQNTNQIVANYINVVPTAGGFTLTLPSAQVVSVGQPVIFNNPSAYSFTLNKADNTLLYTFTPGTTRYIILTNNSTVGGTWNNHPFTAGASNVTSINAISDNDNLEITGVPITSAGTITFDIVKDLGELSGFDTDTGIPCRIGVEEWELREIAGTNNQIGITNPKGIAGDITIYLAPEITGLTSIIVGDIRLSKDLPNSISTSTLNEDLVLDPNGTGLVRISGGGLRIDASSPLYFYATNDTNYVAFDAGNMSVNYSLTWPTTAPAANQVLQYVSGTELGWANVTTFGGPSSVNAVARFSDTIGSLTNSTILLDSSGNITDVTSLEVGNLLLGGIGGLVPNTIASTNVDGGIILGPNGNGEVISTANIAVRAAKKVKFYELAGASNYLSFGSPNSLAAIINYTWPAETPAKSQLMITTAAGTSPTMSLSYMTSDQNLLRNGGFDIWQRNTTFTNATLYFPNNDNTYCADAWKILSDGNNIASVARATGPTSGYNNSQYAWEFTVTTGAAKFGLCQILESNVSIPLQNKNVVLSFAAKGVGTVSLKAAVIGWTGAADSPTSDPISAWGATGVNPTLAASWAYQGTPTAFTVTGSYVTYELDAVAVGSTVTNLGVLIWCDATTGVAANTMTIAAVNLTKGLYYTPYYSKSFQQELLDCKRTFQKDLDYVTSVGTTIVGGTKGVLYVSPIGAAITVPNNISYASILFESEMRTAPTITTYPITTTTNTNRLSDDTLTDLAANSAVVFASLATGFALRNTSGAGITTNGGFYVHYFATADF